MWARNQIKAAGLHDFRVFLAQIWDHLGLPEPTPVQNDMAKYLAKGPKRRMIRAFRGVGKSWITAAYVCWRLFLDPQLKIMIVSANQQLADDISKFIKSLIADVPMLQHLRPNLSKDQRSSNVAFDVGPARPDKSPSVKSVGIKGQLTGSRADLIISDDVEVPKNSMTFLMREQLAELVKEYDAVLVPSGEIVYLGTPQVEQSLYNRLPERGYDVRIWPAEIPASITAYNGMLAPYIMKLCEKLDVGTPVDPLRFDEDDLIERKASYGRAGYALQFMLDTSPADIERHPLKLHDLIVMNVDREVAPVKVVWGNSKDHLLTDLKPGGFDKDYYYGPSWTSEEYAPFGGTVMAIDPSGTGEDETAFAIVRFQHSQLYLVKVGGYKDGFSENTLRGLAMMCARYAVNEVTMERNYGGGMFGQLLRPVVAKVAKARVLPPEECPWSSGQKEVRILNTLEPLIQSHRLVADAECINEDWELQQEHPERSWVYQMTRMHRERGALGHEDRLEAIQIACQHWLDRMDRDQDKSHEVHKQILLDDELRRYMDHALGRTHQDPNWIHGG